MQYIKRILLLMITLGLVYIKIKYYLGFKQDFSFYNIIGLLINILIVGMIVLLVYTSSRIVRQPGIIAFEIFINLFLLFFSLYVPIYYLGANPFTDQFEFIMENLTIINYAQLLLGGWLISTIRILQNPTSVKRGNYNRPRKY